MIISFDVGIKNLAYCIFDNSDIDYKITHWDVANLCGEKPKCCHLTKKVFVVKQLVITFYKKIIIVVHMLKK